MKDLDTYVVDVAAGVDAAAILAVAVIIDEDHDEEDAKKEKRGRGRRRRHVAIRVRPHFAGNPTLYLSTPSIVRVRGILSSQFSLTHNRRGPVPVT